MAAPAGDQPAVGPFGWRRIGSPREPTPSRRLFAVGPVVDTSSGFHDVLQPVGEVDAGLTADVTKNQDGSVGHYPRGPLGQAVVPAALVQLADDGHGDRSLVEQKWTTRYPAMIGLWRNAWSEFIPFLDYDLEIRRVICSTNAIESLNARYRRAVKTRGHFPTDQTAMKCLYLVTRSLDPKGTGQTTWAVRWKPALNRARHHLRRPYAGSREPLTT